ncbi:MAG: hypothetical protein ACJ74F_23660 [Mycobacterium sp.]|uniref:hypothetical protein n=1 Tax=Mycobacterium sp. TaxID=1785 RepID=UPI003899EA37
MRLLARFVAVLLLVGFVGAYFWWIVAAAAVAGLAWLLVDHRRGGRRGSGVAGRSRISGRAG